MIAIIKNKRSQVLVKTEGGAPPAPATLYLQVECALAKPLRCELPTREGSYEDS